MNINIPYFIVDQKGGRKYAIYVKEVDGRTSVTKAQFDSKGQLVGASGRIFPKRKQ